MITASPAASSEPLRVVSFACWAVYHSGAKFEPSASSPAAASTAVRLAKGFKSFSRKATMPSLSQKKAAASRK